MLVELLTERGVFGKRSSENLRFGEFMKKIGEGDRLLLFVLFFLLFLVLFFLLFLRLFLVLFFLLFLVLLLGPILYFRLLFFQT